MTSISASARPGPARAARWMIMAPVLLAAAIGLSGQALVTAGRPTQAVAWASTGLAA